MSDRRLFMVSRPIVQFMAGVASVCLWTLMGCLCMAGSAMADNDLLSLPAPQVPQNRIAASVLMDVVNTGPRLVAVGEGGLIALSEDGGITWTQAGVPTSTTLTAVYFPTASQGWAVGHDGVILHSADGGKSWTKQIDGNTVNRMMLSQIEAITEQKRTLLKTVTDQQGEDLSAELEDLEYFLKDIRAAVQEGPGRPFLDVWFKDELKGVAVGSFGMIFRTVDGGATWRSMLDRIDNHEGYHYYGITLAGSLFLACEGGLLFRSNDDGWTWERLESPLEGSFFGIIGDQRGAFVIAFGLGGIAYRSADLGVFWEAVDAPRSGSLSGACRLSNGTIVITATTGALLQSTDGGMTFNPLSHQFPGCLAAAEVSSGDLVVAGASGLVRIRLNDETGK